MWSVIAPIIGVVVASLFSRFVAQGYLSPEQASGLQNWLMDSLAVGVPGAIAWWLARRGTQRQMVASVAAMPEVTRIYVSAELAAKVDAPEMRIDASAPRADPPAGTPPPLL